MNNRLLSTVFQLVDSFLWWMWKKRQPYGESCGNLIAKGWRWIFFFFLFCLGFNQAGASSGDDAALPLFERLKLLKMRSDDPQALHPPEGNFAPLFRLCLSIFFSTDFPLPVHFFFHHVGNSIPFGLTAIWLPSFQRVFNPFDLFLAICPSLWGFNHSKVSITWQENQN